MQQSWPPQSNYLTANKFSYLQNNIFSHIAYFFHKYNNSYCYYSNMSIHKS
jgi:hypothetical protein